MTKTQKIKTIIIVVLAVVLLFVATYTAYSWFQGSKIRNGVTITTGTLGANVYAYYYIPGASSLTDSLRDNGDETPVVTMSLESMSDVNSIIFVVERDSKSIDMDYSLTLQLENQNGEVVVNNVDVNNSLKYIGGYWFKLAKITSSVASQTGDNSTAKILAYMDGLSTDEKTALNKKDDTAFALSEIGSKVQIDTLADSDYYDYYIFTYGFDGDSTTWQYAQQTIKIRANLSYAQEGALDKDETSSGKTYYISTSANLTDALEKYLPGDTLVFTANVSYTGDLTITRPVNIKTLGGTFTIVGNLVYSFPYTESYSIDTSNGGKIVVKRSSSGSGGYFEIDTPNAMVTFTGKGRANQVADIYVQEMITIDASNKTGEGAILDGVNFFSLLSSGEIPSGTQTYKTIYFKNETRFNVTSQTYVSTFAPAVGTTFSDATRVIAIENYGVIGRVALYNMVYDASYTDLAQIYIDNYGQIDSTIELPSFSSKFQKVDGVNTGNTTIIQEATSNTLSVSEVAETTDNTAPFKDSDIIRVRLQEFVYAVGGDTTNIVVNYADKDDDNESQTLTTLLTDYYTDNIYKVGTTYNVNGFIKAIKSLKVITYEGKVITADDLTLIRDSMTSIETLNLSESDMSNNTLPEKAFNAMKTLKTVNLPESLTTIKNYPFYDCENLYEIYIPATVTSITDSTFQYSYLKYIHFQNVSTVFTSNYIYSGSQNRSGQPYIFVNETILSTYRSKLTSYPHLVIVESTRDATGDIFYRTNTYGQYEITLYVGDISAIQSGLNVGQIKLSESSYVNAQAIGSYAFYGKNFSTASVTVGSSVTSIGDYAFASSTQSNITLSACSLGSYCFTSANITKMDADSVTSLGKGCFKSATLPQTVSLNGITEFNAGEEFYNAAGMLTFTSTSLERIYGWTGLYACKSVERVIVPKCYYFGQGWSNTTGKIREVFSGPVLYMSKDSQSTNENTIWYVCGTNTDIAMDGITKLKDGNIGLVYYMNGYDLCSSWVSSTYKCICTGDVNPLDLIGIEEFKVASTDTLYVPRYRGAVQQNGEVTIVGCNMLTISSSTFSSKTLEVPSTATYTSGTETVTANITAIGANAFRSSSISDVSINIPSTVKSIGDAAFYKNGTKTITNFNCGDLDYIGSYAFGSGTYETFTCGNVTSAGDYAFSSAKVTDTMTIGTIGTLGTYAFSSCNIANLTTGKITTSGIRVFDSAKVSNGTIGIVEALDYSCYNTSLTNCNFSYLTTISGYKGFQSASLNGCTFPALKTISGYGAFQEATFSDSTISFPALEEVTNSDAFRASKGFVKILLPSLKKITGTFLYGQNVVEYVYAPKLVNTPTSCVFRECSKLHTLYLGAYSNYAPASGMYFFYGCSNVTNIFICGDVPSGFQGTETCPSYNGSNINASKLTVYAKASVCEQLKDSLLKPGVVGQIVALNTDPGTVDIYRDGEYLLNNCTVSLGQYQYELDNTNLTARLLRCNLDSITTNYQVPDTISVTKGDDTVVYKVTELANGVFSKVAMTGISVTMGANATTIGEGAFAVAISTAKKSFTFFNGANVKTIGENAFKGVTIEGDATFTSAETIGNYAFNSATIKGGATFGNATSIGSYAFTSAVITGNVSLGNSNLQTATTVSDYAFNGTVVGGAFSLLGKDISIGTYAFSGANITGNVTIPNATSIATYAFNKANIGGNVSLGSASIPASIGTYAFSGAVIGGNLNVAGATSVETYAFNKANIGGNVDLTNAPELGTYAFTGSNVTGDITLTKCKTVGANAFNGATVSGTISLPFTSDTEKQTICTSAFQGATLKNVNSNATTVEASAFQSATINGTLTLPEATTLYTPCFYNTVLKQKTLNLPKVTEVLGTMSISSVSNSASAVFYGCNVYEVKLPKLPTIPDYMCYASKIINLEIDTATSAGYRVISSSTIERLYTPCVTDDSSDSSYAFFYNCGSLREVTIGQTGTFKYHHIYGCSSLKYICIAGTKLERSYSVSGGFFGYYKSTIQIVACSEVCANLYNNSKFLAISNFVDTGTNDPAKLVGSYETTTLNSYDIPSYKGFVNDGKFDIALCYKTITDSELELDTMKLASGTTCKIGKICANAFKNTTISATTLTLGNGVTEVGAYAFNSKAFTTVNVNGDTTIKTNAFNGVSTIKNLCITGKAVLEANSFASLSGANVRITGYDYVIDSTGAFGTNTNNTLAVNADVYAGYTAIAPWNGIALANISTYTNYVEVNGIKYYYNYDSEKDKVEIAYVVGDATNSQANGVLTMPTSVTVSGATKNVTSLDTYVLRDISGYTKIVLPSNLTELNFNHSYIASTIQAFEIDSANEKYKTIDGVLYALRDNKAELLVCYPMAKTSATYTVDGECKFISTYAFSGAKSLTSITISSANICISDYAFANCTDGLAIEFTSSTPALVIGSYVFDGLTNYTIYVPTNALSEYQKGIFLDTSILSHIQTK